MALGVIFFVVNTLEHLIKTKREASPEKPPVQEVVANRFTIQVAAYLNAEHATRYVEHLKKLGLDAYWKEAQGAKKKWYQVRVSHFPDKASARDYGEALKSKGIIDDFYVANYQRL